MFLIKFILFHKYQNKEELNNSIFESNVFNNNRFSLLITLDPHTFFILSGKVRIRPEMKNKILIHNCNSACLPANLKISQDLMGQNPTDLS